MKQQKHVRLTLEFTVTVDDASLTADEPRDEEYIKLQRRLLQAILADKEHFHKYLQWEITTFFELMDWQSWYEVLMGNQDASSHDVLAPIIETLNAQDQQFFAVAVQNGVFSESTEEMTDCFNTTLERSELVVEEDGNE